jgi:uncharacterized protein (DUF3084 family)
MMSRGESIIAVNADAATDIPNIAIGCVVSAISLNPASGSAKIADKKDDIHDSTVLSRTE